MAAVAGILAVDIVVFLRPQYVDDARLREASQVVYSPAGKRSRVGRTRGWISKSGSGTMSTRSTSKIGFGGIRPSMASP